MGVGVRIIFYKWKLLEKKKPFNFHSIFAFSLRDKLKPETNMRKKAAAQRRRQVNAERVRREPLGFLHVARGDYCDRVEGWYSKTSQNQLPLSGCYSWPTKCAPRTWFPGCVVLWPLKGRAQW